MKKIKKMIQEAPDATSARWLLDTMQIFSNITESEYQKGKELIRKEFKK